MSRKPQHRLSYSANALGIIEDLLRRAPRPGVFARVSAALLAIERELQIDPRAWGDPLRNYYGLRATLYIRAYDELVVYFTVHDDQPEVWLQRLAPVLGHPLRTD